MKRKEERRILASELYKSKQVTDPSSPHYGQDLNSPFKQSLRQVCENNYALLKRHVKAQVELWQSYDITVVLNKHERFDPPVNLFRHWLPDDPDPDDSTKAMMFDGLLWEALQEGD